MAQMKMYMELPIGRRPEAPNQPKSPTRSGAAWSIDGKCQTNDRVQSAWSIVGDTSTHSDRDCVQPVDARVGRSTFHGSLTFRRGRRSGSVSHRVLWPVALSDTNWKSGVDAVEVRICVNDQH